MAQGSTKESTLLLRPFSERGDFVLAACLSAVHILLVSFNYVVVPEPYMDEIFHIAQTRRYCTGDFRWDPMITTPPLLYLLSMPLCSGYERYINSVLIFFAYVVSCRFRRMFTRSTVEFSALTVVLLPVLFDSSVIFYTDLLSLVLVLAGFTSVGPFQSSVFFLLSCCTRQTNIVWAGLYGIVRMYYRFKSGQPVRSIFNSVLKLFPLVILACLFLVFLYVNKGIVLGDPSAHEPKLHLAQFGYLLLFCVLHTWPHYTLHLSYLVSSMLHYSTFIFTAVFFFAIHYGSFDHPYLLADNRHVPFYLWRWFLKSPTYRVALAPIYAVSLISLRKFSSHIPTFIQFVFTCACLAVIVPAHLLEFRYFIVPYALWRLSANTSSSLLICCVEVLSQIIISFFVLFIFWFRPFVWVNHPGEKQRFMW